MVSVQASWRAPSGAPRRGQITVPSGLMAGARVNIWVDAAGEQRLAPPSVASVRVGAVISGVAASASVVILLVWLQLILVWTLNRKRYAAWAKEWERVGPRWRY